MTNDEVYLVIKEEGVKNVIKSYITNAPSNHWVVWTKMGNVFMVDEDFFLKYELNPVFTEQCGEMVFKRWKIDKYPKKIWKKKILETV